MNHEYERINNLAQRLCAQSGRDWNRKGCKRNGWRKKAKAKLSVNIGLADSLMSIFGYRRAAK